MKKKTNRCKWALKEPYLIDKKDNRYKDFSKHLKETGISPDETWSLYNVISEFVLPRLKLFKEDHGGYPMGMTGEQWNEILDKMIFAFEWTEMEDKMTPEYEALTKEQKDKAWKKYEEGVELFAEYFMALWW